MILSRNFKYLAVGCLAKFPARRRELPCIDNKTSFGSYCLPVTQMAPLFHVLNAIDIKGWGTETSAPPRCSRKCLGERTDGGIQNGICNKQRFIGRILTEWLVVAGATGVQWGPIPRCRTYRVINSLLRPSASISSPAKWRY